MKSSKRLWRLSVLGVAFCLMMANLGMVAVPAVKAADDSMDKDTKWQNEMYDNYFYRKGCKNKEKCVAATGDQVTWIGDSYSVGAHEKIETKLSGISFGGSVDDASSTIQGSKFIDSGDDKENPSGLSILQKIKDAGELKPYLVFALGTNGGIDSGKIDKVMDTVGDDAQVVFTTIYVTSEASQIVQNYIDSSNKAVNEAKSRYSNVSVADWAAVAKDDYYKSDPSGVHPFDNYDLWVDTIVEALPENCTGDGVLLPGANVTEKIWNWLVNYFNGQNLSNVNISALVSGILGNFEAETGMHPLAIGYTGCYYGIFMYMCIDNGYGGDDMRAEINAALGGDYYRKPYGSNHETVDDLLKKEGMTDEQIDTAISMTLEAMTEKDSYWTQFMEGLKTWGVADTPEGYADLFNAVIERSTPGDAYLNDPAVRKHYGGTFQSVAKRENFAKEFYEKYSGSTSINPTITTGSAAISGAEQAMAVGTNKNYAGDTVWGEAELEKIENNKSVYQSAAQQYGIPWQAIATVHRLESSLSLTNPSNGQGLYQLYTYTGGGANSNAFAPGAAVDEAEFQRQTNIATEFMKNTIEKAGYAVDSDEGIKYLFFEYNGSASKYKEKALAMGFSQEEANIGEGSPYVMNRYDAKRDPNSSEMDANWPGAYIEDRVYTEGATVDWFGAYVFYTALGGGSGDNGDICPSSSTGNKLADYVLKYAWPEFKGWGFLDPMPDYKEAVDRRRKEGKYVGSSKSYGDCGGFVTTLMQESGFDVNYNLASEATYGQENYVVNSPDWELVNPGYGSPIKDESELHPGDVAFSSCGGGAGTCGHTYVYVGDIPGFGSRIASASWDRRVPMAVTHEQIVSAGVHWYHKVK